MCLGQEDAADLRTPLCASEGNELLNGTIRKAIARNFILDRADDRPPVARHISVTGG